MRNYLLLKLLLVVLLAVGLFVMFCGWGAIPLHSIMVLGFATFVAAMVIANELRRPMPQEYFRKKALFPKIPNKFLASKPQSGSIIFGKDYHTHKTVVSEIGHIRLA